MPDELMTQYDVIRNLSVQEMAEFFYELIEARDQYWEERLQREGINFTTIKLSKELVVAKHMQYLMSKVGDSDEV